MSTAAALFNHHTFILRLLENSSLNFRYSNLGNSEMSLLESVRGKTKLPQLTFSWPGFFTIHILQSDYKRISFNGLNTFLWEKRFTF